MSKCTYFLLNTHTYTHTDRHTQTPSLACVIYDFFLPAGQNESTCHDLLSVFNMHDSLQSGLIKFGSKSRTVHGSEVAGSPHDYISNLFGS